ncbi:MAG: DUF2177 family protein [Alphaproteobacteria bacterium]|nr:DUF2177 family protein [Alphaproteobacteria bacterium]
MRIFVRAYIGAFLAFCVMDSLWLGLIATDFYFGALGGLLREEPNWMAAIIFYLGYVAGVVYFAVLPISRQGGWWAAAKRGALLGLLAYATYDMTNLATLVGWSLSVSLVDMFWGMVITGTAAAAGFLASLRVRT